MLNLKFNIKMERLYFLYDILDNINMSVKDASIQLFLSYSQILHLNCKSNYSKL